MKAVNGKLSEKIKAQLDGCASLNFSLIFILAICEKLTANGCDWIQASCKIFLLTRKSRFSSDGLELFNSFGSVEDSAKSRAGPSGQNLEARDQMHFNFADIYDFARSNVARVVLRARLSHKTGPASI